MPNAEEISDGFHTMAELYHHRAVLFSVIVRDHRELAWKARKHHDGTMYDGMFIVGIETPRGQATYHYDLDPYWEMFDCEEREYAPEWDGHTPDDAIARIAALGSGTCRLDETASYSNANEVIHLLECSECGRTCEHVNGSYPRCPHCGRRVSDATPRGDDLYDAGFSNGVQAVFQQLEGIEDYDELQDFISEYWEEGEGHDER